MDPHRRERERERERVVRTCGWFLRQAFRSSARRPRAIPPDMALFLSFSLSRSAQSFYFSLLDSSGFVLWIF